MTFLKIYRFKYYIKPSVNTGKDCYISKNVFQVAKILLKDVYVHKNAFLWWKLPMYVYMKPSEFQLLIIIVVNEYM